MMSDHWKSLANFLGTPGPAEPVAKELAKKKPEVAADEPKAVDTDPTPVRDPLAEIVIRDPDPIVPGFTVPEPEPVAQKPARRSAWDALIGTLGIKVSDEPEVEQVVPVREVVMPDREVSASSRTFSSESTTPPARNERTRPRSTFGSGLVGDDEPEAVESVAQEANPVIQKPRAPRRESSRPEPRTSEPRKTEQTGRHGFADGLIDWDAEPIDADLDIDESLDDEPLTTNLDSTKPDVRRNQSASRGDDDRPRSRGRRGGSRNRGHDELRDDSRPAPISDDVIGWGDEIDDVDDEPIRKEPGRSEAPRSDRDREGRRPRRDDVPRSERGNVERGRDETARDRPPRDERPREERTREERPREERTRPERSGGERSGGERSSGERSGGERSGGERSGGERSGGERSGGERSGGERPREDASSASRRGGRRGQRQLMPGPEVEPRSIRETPVRNRRDELPLEPDLDFVDDDDLILDEIALPGTDSDGTDTADETIGRPRRRRGRRGRGGGSPSGERTGSDRAPNSDRALNSDRVPNDRSERKSPPPSRSAVSREPVDDDPFEDDLLPEAIDAVELDDDHEDDEEVERIQRGRRRGRGRDDSRTRRDVAGDSDSLAPAGSGASEPNAAPKHRNVPTWLDTIKLLVESNIERHRRSGSSRPPQNRGGGRR